MSCLISEARLNQKHNHALQSSTVITEQWNRTHVPFPVPSRNTGHRVSGLSYLSKSALIITAGSLGQQKNCKAF